MSRRGMSDVATPTEDLSYAPSSSSRLSVSEDAGASVASSPALHGKLQDIALTSPYNDNTISELHEPHEMSDGAVNHVDALADAEALEQTTKFAPPGTEAEEHVMMVWSESRKAWRPCVMVPKKSPYAGEAEAPQPVRTIGDIRVITYNVWFNDETDRRLRHRALFKLCLTSKRDVDIICLQEMTVEAYEELLGLSVFDSDDPLRSMVERCVKLLRRDWFVTEFLPQSMLFRRGIWFGTVILVNRAFTNRLKTTMRVKSVPLPSSSNRRLHYVEMIRDPEVVFRAACFHLDGMPIAVDLRKSQFAAMANTLCSDGVPCIMAGDSNIVTFEEIEGVTAAPHCLVDAMRDIDTSPTFNTTYTTPEGRTARIDLVLISPDLKVVGGEVLGRKPFPIPAGVQKPKRLGVGGHVYPSDHLGVYVHIRHQ